MAFRRWGLSARKKLKKTSPFASLLLELGPGLSDEDVSGLRLAITVDKVISRKKLSSFKNGSDLLLLLYEADLISPTDTGFLEHLLNKIGRKDLERLVRTYSEKRTAQSENTPPSSSESTKPKTVFSPIFTRLKPPSNDSSPMHTLHGPPALDSSNSGPLAVDSPAGSPSSRHSRSPVPGVSQAGLRPPVMGQARLSPTSAALGIEVGQEIGAIGVSPHTGQFSTLTSTMPLQPWLCVRPNTEGMSNAFTQIQPSKSDVSNLSDSPQEDSWTQMSIDSSQKSAMSISDDEKMYLCDKMLHMENEENASFPL